jgi:hypothetical protein
VSCHNPNILRWFVQRGLDLEEALPFARAFRYKNRQFLGIFMDNRDKVPSARAQAAMALRFHVCGRNEKWIALLLWAGADPRLEVPDLEYPDNASSKGTALSDAVRYGNIAFVKKIGLDPDRDNLSTLLSDCLIMEDTALVQMLLDAGADPNGGQSDDNPMRSLMRNFLWSFDRTFGFCRRTPEVSTKCLELAAERGGRWQPEDDHDYSNIRRHLTKAPAYEVVPLLFRLWQAGVFTPDVFKELMRTPRMKDLLLGGGTQAAELREVAGHRKPPSKSRRMQWCVSK